MSSRKVALALAALGLGVAQAFVRLARPRYSLGAHTTSPPRRSLSASALAEEDIMVVMNGLPGAMGREVAAACQRRGMKLAPFALTGASYGGDTVDVGGVSVSLVDGTNTAAADSAAEAAKMAAAAAGCKRIVCIDYTHPTAVKGNAEW